MADLGIAHEVDRPDIDEKAIRKSDPRELVLAIAAAKAEALIGRHPDTIVITADQVVTHDGTIREKPDDTQEAAEFLRSYGNNKATTVSGLHVVNTSNGKVAFGIDEASVHFKVIPEDVIAQVIAKGEVMYCAGGFMVEEPLLQPYIERVDGTIDSIQGLPITLLKQLLADVQTPL
eukprot:GILK01005147.1.p1 GENE.GILK01005147.1~~GILK01005147.1.p1  ORF type:complete len:203 (-),score=29.14 GILK01005147.1:103-630(-)